VEGTTMISISIFGTVIVVVVVVVVVVNVMKMKELAYNCSVILGIWQRKIALYEKMGVSNCSTRMNELPSGGMSGILPTWFVRNEKTSF